MTLNKAFFQYIIFVAFSSVGGFLISLTGLSIGWMIGTMLMSTFLSFQRPKFLQIPESKKGIPKYWLYIGQCILGIELGQKMNASVIFMFTDHWLTIVFMLLLSIVFALLSGIVLWRYTKLDLLTSLFATIPGGLSTIPGIAEEVGANTGIVSIIQTIRSFLVIFMIPVVLSTVSFDGSSSGYHHAISTIAPKFETTQLIWTALLVGVAVLGYYLGKHLRFPAPWLIGGMVSVGLFKSIAAIYNGFDIVPWWPHWIIILSQIFIGASIGSRFHKGMFSGLHKILVVSSLSTIGFITSMFGCAYIVTALTGMSITTSALAFAPGGIAEMTTTSIILHADSTFVVAVQVLRVISVCTILPLLFRYLHHLKTKKNIHRKKSA